MVETRQMARLKREREAREAEEGREDVNEEVGESSTPSSIVVDVERFMDIPKKELMSPGFDCNEPTQVTDNNGEDYLVYLREYSDEEDGKNGGDKEEEDPWFEEEDLSTSDGDEAFETGCDSGSDVDSDMYAPSYLKDL